jgi:uncharacterized OsmC-like protein
MKRVEKDDSLTLSFVKVKWIDGMRFVATDSMGHSIVMDASKQSGSEGSGFSPLQLLLIALRGCTGMDIIHIMRKQRQQVDDLEILVSGKRVKEPPESTTTFMWNTRSRERTSKKRQFNVLYSFPKTNTALWEPR